MNIPTTCACGAEVYRRRDDSEFTRIDTENTLDPDWVNDPLGHVREAIVVSDLLAQRPELDVVRGAGIAVYEAGRSS